MGWELMLFLGGSAGVLAGCLVPARWLPPLPNDKLMHFTAFAILALLSQRIAHGHSEQAVWLLGLLIAGLCVEILQQLVPGRKFCWRDMGANAAGIAVATLVFQIVSGT